MLEYVPCLVSSSIVTLQAHEGAEEKEVTLKRNSQNFLEDCYKSRNRGTKYVAEHVNVIEGEERSSMKRRVFVL